jgi:hypothetical protein
MSQYKGKYQLSHNLASGWGAVGAIVRAAVRGLMAAAIPTLPFVAVAVVVVDVAVAGREPVAVGGVWKATPRPADAVFAGVIVFAGAKEARGGVTGSVNRPDAFPFDSFFAASFFRSRSGISDSKQDISVNG